MPESNKIKYITRQATSKDIDKMTSLDEMCFSIPWTRKDFKKELTDNRLALYMVAESDGKIIGYAGVWCIMDEGHITNVAVHPDYRNNGVGMNLVDKMLKEARARTSVNKFTLEVRVSNQAAINLYEGFGFKEFGKRLGYYSDNKEDAAIMWLLDN